ncbi:hypothetical protein [Streptomyces wuyuanensis]|uniref:hypothetical protein n=1 Tax=Streptomyces wuyuanensis TaxID=1196353 RepID=UPI0034281E04
MYPTSNSTDALAVAQLSLEEARYIVGEVAAEAERVATTALHSVTRGPIASCLYFKELNQAHKAYIHGIQAAAGELISSAQLYIDTIREHQTIVDGSLGFDPNSHEEPVYSVNSLVYLNNQIAGVALKYAADVESAQFLYSEKYQTFLHNVHSLTDTFKWHISQHASISIDLADSALLAAGDLVRKGVCAGTIIGVSCVAMPLLVGGFCTISVASAAVGTVIAAVRSVQAIQQWFSG